MITLLKVVVPAMLLVLLSDYYSVKVQYPNGAVRYVQKEKFFYLLAAVVLALFVGLRLSGNDTFTYRNIYENLGTPEGIFDHVNWKPASAPGLTILMNALLLIGASTQDYLMVTALFTILVYLWFIRKYSCRLSLSIYYFITMGVYTFAMAAIKQTMAVAFLLLATDRAIGKKYARFAIWIAVAELFHPYAFIYLVVPFLFFKPWTRKTWLLILITIVASMSLQRLMGGIMDVTANLGYTRYTSTEFLGEGVSIFRVLAVMAPVLLSYLVKDKLMVSEDRTGNLFVNLTMVNAFIMFIGLFGTANYFARLANYFLIFQTLSLPFLMDLFDGETRKMVEYASILLYAFYCYYESVLAHGAFDLGYRFMTIFDFIRQIA